MRRFGLHRVPLRLLLAGLLCAAIPISSLRRRSRGNLEAAHVIRRKRGRLSILKLRMEDEQLKGVLVDYQGAETPIKNVTCDDGKLSFEILSMRRGQPFTSRYVGTLADDTIAGTALGERRGRTTTVDWIATRTSSEEVYPEIEPPSVAADVGLNEENYTTWRDHILPNPSEMAWEQIPWLTTFKDGILAADAADKPLLLWTMNGHPLGCT